MKRRYILAPLAVLAALVLAACGPSGPPPTQIALNISTSPDVNGGASAKIQVFYLKAAGGFQTADYFSLSDNAPAALGTDLAGQGEYLVNAGAGQADAVSIPAAVTHVGVIVAYRDLGASVWRGLAAVQPGAANSVSIEVSRTAVNVIGK